MRVDHHPPADRSTMTAVVTNEAIQQRVAAWFPGLSDRRRYQVHTDASDFYRMD
jgi:hypothetical protein